MHHNLSMFSRNATRVAALGVWAAVAAAGVFWGMKLFVRPEPMPAQARTVSPTQALRGDLTRLLGAAAEPAATVAPVAAAASRFRLVGVVAPRSPKAAGEGLALIAIDGKSPRAYRVGAMVEGELVLQRVHARGADLGARGAASASVALDVAALPPPATGVPGQAAGLAAPGGQRLPAILMGRPGQPRPPNGAAEPAQGEAEGADEPPQPAQLARPGLETR